MMTLQRMLCLLFCAVLASFSFAQTVSGRLEKDTLLDAASSPWRITGDVIVPEGVTLTIEAGAVLRITAGKFLLAEGGRLSAEGTADRRIQMIAETGKWKGIRLVDTLENNLLHCVDMIDGDGETQAILIDRSRVHVFGCTWSTANKTIIEVNHPSALIEGCIFPTVVEKEVIHGLYLEKEEYLILRGNTFGPTTGYNDIIDFTDCKRPGPILQVYDNLFLGGGDDGLDLDGTDCHIEGNVFTNFHKGHTSSSTSNAIATGLRNGKTSDIMVVRNIFYDNDHAVLLKEECFMHAENNTFVNHPQGVINFSEWPDRNVAPGKGAFLDGNIFWQHGQPFENLISQPGQPNPTIVVNRSIINASFHHFGVGNIDADPLFINSAQNFHLQPNSPAIGAGPNGLNAGAFVPNGASISGEPAPLTTETEAFLTIGGPGIVTYQFSLDDPVSGWSEERTVADQPTIDLTDLQVGESHTVFVRGKNSAGAWQSEPPYAVSKSWTIIPATSIKTPSDMPANSLAVSVFPNPFNSKAFIRFYTECETRLTITAYDVLGRKARAIDSGTWSAGAHAVAFDAENLAGGIYFIRVEGDGILSEHRVFLIK